MGVVFLAEDVHLQRTIALKTMLPELAGEPTAKERFLREARAAAKLEHDHIVTIHQVAEDRGVLFIAMPFLKGASLEEYLSEREKAQPGQVLTLSQILKIGREIAKGLAAAHECGLIHRDVKPANIWLDASVGGRAKILDFGLARANVGDKVVTQLNAVVGTPAYMAPEQGQGQKVDARADLFSLGVILYRMCTGKLPFPGADIMAILMSMARHDPMPPHQMNENVPFALSELVMKLLAKEPSQRIGSAKEVVQALQAVEKKLGSSAILSEAALTDNSSAPPRTPRKAKQTVLLGQSEELSPQPVRVPKKSRITTLQGHSNPTPPEEPVGMSTPVSETNKRLVLAGVVLFMAAVLGLLAGFVFR